MTIKDFDLRGSSGLRILGVVHYEECDEVHLKYEDGREFEEKLSENDLFIAIEKHEKYAALYRDSMSENKNAICLGAKLLNSKQEIEELFSKDSCYITAVKVEWEE